MSYEQDYAAAQALGADAVRFLLEPDDFTYRSEFLLGLKRSDFRVAEHGTIFDLCCDLEDRSPGMWETRDVIQAWIAAGNVNANADVNAILATLLPPVTRVAAETLLSEVIALRRRLIVSEMLTSAALTAQHDGIINPDAFIQQFNADVAAKLDTSVAWAAYPADRMPVKANTGWVLHELLAIGEVLIFSAPPGSGKSLLLRQLAWAASNALHPWDGQILPAVMPMTTLLLDFESHDHDVFNTFTTMRSRLGQDPSFTFHITEPWVRVHRGRVNIRRGTDDEAHLRALIRKVQPKLVCLGPLKNIYTEEGNENYQAAALAVQGALTRMAEEFGFALAIEAHGSRADTGQIAGSQRWQDWPDVSLSLEVVTAEWAKQHTNSPISGFASMASFFNALGAIPGQRVLQVVNRRASHRNAGCRTPLGLLSHSTVGTYMWRAIWS